MVTSTYPAPARAYSDGVVYRTILIEYSRPHADGTRPSVSGSL